MSWQRWADELRQESRQAVADLLRGAADISPYERVAPHEFLLAVLPRDSRLVNQTLLGEPPAGSTETDMAADLPALLDTGLSAWLLAQHEAALLPAKKLGAYAAQVCEALQWPLYFALPQTRAVLQAERAQWLRWLGTLTLSAYRDPEYDYWQVLASKQADDNLQFFWQSFVAEAGRTRSARYLNFGLLALAKLPLLEDDSLRNLRLQVQALVNRYQHRKAWGAPAQEELAENLRTIMARNPSMDEGNYRAFLSASLAPLGEDKAASVLSLLGFGTDVQSYGTVSKSLYKLTPPGSLEIHNQAVRDINQSGSLAQAWQVMSSLLSAHEAYLHKSGDAYYFVRNLDRCGRALCGKYSLRDPEIRERLFQWIHLSLRMDADNPMLWMLWELALRKADQPQRAQWVLWEMTRRFPDNLHCRLELARMLAESDTPDDQAQAHRLLQRVLQQAPYDLYAHSTLAQLAIRREDWAQALSHAQQGLRIDPGHQPCALLLAQAYARRNEPGDLQTATEHLQQFVTRYRGNLKAEDYLHKLLQRQQLAEQGQLTAFKKDEESAANMEAAPAETDPAWLAFAESLCASPSVDISAASSIADAGLVDRILPLPQALRQAVAQGLWEEEVLDRYEADAQREFPLETRLWHYLKTLRSDSPDSERDRARQAVQAWLDAETQALGQDKQGNESWVNYRNKHWEALNASADTALATGAEWLKDLLDRYHPLPAPLLA